MNEQARYVLYSIKSIVQTKHYYPIVLYCNSNYIINYPYNSKLSIYNVNILWYLKIHVFQYYTFIIRICYRLLPKLFNFYNLSLAIYIYSDFKFQLN